MKSFLAGAAVSAVMIAGAMMPANAATSTCAAVAQSASCTIAEGIVTGYAPTSQFTLDRSGTPVGKLPNATVSFTDYYTFTIGATPLSIDASYTLSGVGSAKPSGVSLTLFSGLPGSGTQVAAKPGNPTKVTSPGASLSANLTSGTYYLQVKGVSGGPSGGYGGTVSFANTVPLPNSVALFGVAVAGLGIAGAARRRSVRSTMA